VFGGDSHQSSQQSVYASIAPVVEWEPIRIRRLHDDFANCVDTCIDEKKFRICGFGALLCSLMVPVVEPKNIVDVGLRLSMKGITPTLGERYGDVVWEVIVLTLTLVSAN
jgi:hypothetical protein